MLYRIAAVTLACSLLISCDDENAFYESTTTTTTTTTSGGGGGGDSGTATGSSQVSIARVTQIPSTIPDGSGGTLVVSFKWFDMGNSDDSIAYLMTDNGQPSSARIFRPDASGPLELYSRPLTAAGTDTILTTVSGDGSKILFVDNIMDVIDYTDGNTTAIGTVLGGPRVETITDAGDFVALFSFANLTGGNPSLVNQLYTLSTDGADTYNQLTTFTTNHFIDSVVISGNGSRVFFSSNDDVLEDGSNADGSYEIFSINTDGSGLAQLSNFDAGFLKITDSSSDGSVLAIEINDLNIDGIKEALAFNTSGGTPTKIAETLAGAEIDYAMSADGSSAAYLRAGDRAGEFLIYLVNINSGTETELFKAQGAMNGLQMNNDGSKISFYSNIEFDTPIETGELATQIYTMTQQ